MTQQGIWVLGGYRSDFARNLAREGIEVDGLTAEVVRGTLADAGLRGTDIDTVHVGNAFGQLSSVVAGTLQLTPVQLTSQAIWTARPPIVARCCG